MSFEEILQRKIIERDEKINSNIRFYHKKLGNTNGYKLYDIELEGLTYEPAAKPKRSAYAVSSNQAKNMKNSKADLNTYKQVKNNSKKFRKNNLKKNKKKKGMVTAVTALLLAGIMGVTGFFVGKLFGKKNDKGSNTNASISQLGTGSLDSLGEELSKDDKNSEYTKLSGDFNIEDIVRGADGLLYVDEESARNASKSGTSEIDTQGGSLVVGDNGKVYTQEEGYEIVDENGDVIESGTGNPSVNEGIDYVECPCNYYDDEGNLVHSAGDYITPEELERCKQYYHTTKPEGDEYVTVEEEVIYYDEEEVISTGNEETEEEVIDEETEEETTEEEVTQEDTQEENVETSYSEGVFNADGSYTIYGVTYASYADYQQYIINGGAGYGYVNGVIQPIGDYEVDNQYTR